MPEIRSISQLIKEVRIKKEITAPYLAEVLEFVQKTIENQAKVLDDFMDFEDARYIEIQEKLEKIQGQRGFWSRLCERKKISTSPLKKY